MNCESAEDQSKEMGNHGIALFRYTPSPVQMRRNLAPGVALLRYQAIENPCKPLSRLSDEYSVWNVGTP